MKLLIKLQIFHLRLIQINKQKKLNRNTKRKIYISTKKTKIFVIWDKSNNIIKKIIILLDDTPNQAANFKVKKWVELNDDLRGMYNTNSKSKFKILMLKSTLCDYGNACSWSEL